MDICSRQAPKQRKLESGIQKGLRHESLLCTTDMAGNVCRKWMSCSESSGSTSFSGQYTSGCIDRIVIQKPSGCHNHQIDWEMVSHNMIKNLDLLSQEFRKVEQQQFICCIINWQDKLITKVTKYETNGRKW